VATPTSETLEQARQYVARISCGGRHKPGILSAFEVRKEGSDSGRLFAKCRHSGHFDWLTPAASADEEHDRTEAYATPCPKCGKVRHARRVGRDGPDKGRLCLACPDRACDGFEWASPAPSCTVELTA
jgi:hypothetical protein